MGELTRYRVADMAALMEKLNKNAIGMNEYFDKVFEGTSPSNYPPYNLIQLNNIETRLEIALAGFKKEEVHAFTEYGKLFVRGEKEAPDEEGTYVHKGLAQRNFERSWTLAEGTEVTDVLFEDGLLSITVKKVVPEHHARKDYL
jgi:HSP20 family molecular chaperone IbpA